MAKKRRSYPRSANTRTKIDFWPPNLTIYEQTVQSENAISKMKVDVKPHSPNKPTLESNLKIDKE